MKRSICLLALYFFGVINCNASSVVSLAGGGNVPAATALNISLTGLVPGMNYSVVCYIDTTFPFQFVKLGSSFTDPTSTVTSYSLNGNYVTQAQLIAGHNVVVVNGFFASPTTGNIVITNLDQTNTFNVNNCFGVPIQV